MNSELKPLISATAFFYLKIEKMSIVVEFIKDVTVLSVSLLDDAEENVFVKKGSVFEAEGMSMNEDRVTLRFLDDSVFSEVPISCVKPSIRKEIEKASRESAKKNEQ